MSHAATNWAIQQRGLKPATKIVLWHLCDRHNPDRGCFPSQERLADDCEMARSTVQLHLNALAKRGLIRRERSKDPATNRENPTRYFFAFEDGYETETSEEDPQSRDRKSVTGAVTEKGAEPRPKNGKSRDRKSVSNPVREPLREPARARGGDPDGPPRDAQGAQAAGEELRLLRRAERKVLVKWVLNGDVEALDTISLTTERLRFPVSGEEARAYVLGQSPPSIRRVAGFAQWAFDVLAGKTCSEEPIDEVRRIIADLQHDRFGERVRARCQILIDWRKANPADARAGKCDDESDNQQTEDAA